MASSLFSASALHGIGADVESRRKSARGRYYNAQFPSRSLAFARDRVSGDCVKYRKIIGDKCNRFFGDLTLLRLYYIFSKQ